MDSAVDAITSLHSRMRRGSHTMADAVKAQVSSGILFKHLSETGQDKMLVERVLAVRAQYEGGSFPSALELDQMADNLKRLGVEVEGVDFTRIFTPDRKIRIAAADSLSWGGLEPLGRRLQVLLSAAQRSGAVYGKAGTPLVLARRDMATPEWCREAMIASAELLLLAAIAGAVCYYSGGLNQYACASAAYFGAAGAAAMYITALYCA